jgi:hypothetical protein
VKTKDIRKSRAPQRRWWQVVCRAAVVVAAALAGAYVTLPWWAPTGLVRRWLAAEIARQTGLEVRIDRLSLSWGRGVELNGLTISSTPGTGPEPLAYIESIRMAFSPVDMLVHKRIEWMELNRPRVSVRCGPDGSFNIERLTRLDFQAKAQRVTQRQGAATFTVPGHDVKLHLDIRDLQIFPGKMRGLGQVTMAAWLRQQSGAAPVSFHFTDQPMNSGAAAQASFSFTDLDLAELGLNDALDLPLERLHGRCDGSLDLQMNRQGEVDRFIAKLSIRDLDVQPVGGARLPLIKHAGFEISAAIDLFASQDTINVDLQSTAVRLPGVDLEGLKLSMSKPIGKTPRIRSLDLIGTVYPGRLAALLKGQNGPPGGLACAGPVRIEKLIITRKGPTVDFAVAADATEAELSRAGKAVKPRNTKLRITLEGALDERKWDLSIHNSRLDLADNWIEHQVQLADAKAFLEGLLRQNHEPTDQTLRDLSVIASTGRLHLQELKSISAIAPSLAGALGDVELRGPARGRWEFAGGRDHADRAAFEANLDLESQTRLKVKNWFIKPPGKETHLGVTGHLVSRGPAGARNSDIDLILDKLDFAVGGGRLHTDGAELRFRASTGGGTSATMQATGGFDISQVEQLLACLGDLQELASGITGDVRNGRYAVGPGPGKQDVRISADLTDVSLKLGELFVKPAGQSAELKLTYTREEPSGPDGQNRLELTGSLFPPAQRARGAARTAAVDLKAAIPLGQGPDEKPSRKNLAAIEVKFNDADASWLAQSCPAIRDRLNNQRLEGALVSGAAHINVGKDGSVAAEVRREQPITLKTGDTNIALSGRGSLRPDDRGGGPDNSLPTIDSFDVHVDGKLSFDTELFRLLPQIESPAAEHGIRGTVRLSADVRGDDQSISIANAEADAEKLSVNRIGPMVKPAGTPANFQFAATINPDLSAATLELLTGRIGDVSLQATGGGRFDYSAEGLPDPRAWRLALRATTENARKLQDLVPALKEWSLSGGARVDAMIIGAENKDIASRVELVAKGLGGRYGRTDFALDGELTLELVRPGAGTEPYVERADTDKLEVRIGANRAWVVAHVERLNENPKGRIDVLAEFIDDENLADSLYSLAKGLRSTVRGAHGAAGDKETPAQRAERITGQIRDWLGKADLAATVSLGHLKKYDKSVKQHYDIQRLELSASAVGGDVSLSYAGGLNGGQASGQWQMNLAEAAPKVLAQSEFKDVIATEAIQPQLAKHFPGNHVNGYFNRSEKVTFPLVDLVANVIDPDQRIRSAGTAKTVTIDGTIAGRAAPQFISDIFPGLNLARYQYRTMTGFANLKEDGSANNDMIFDGRYYDLYITGTTDSKNIGRYQIGVILLSAPQSAEWNHAYRLGRIPVLNFEARIEGGQMYDVKVPYLRPDEVIGAILLTNNPLYRLLTGP